MTKPMELNHAFDQYRGNEATAFRVAWAAVKKRYEKVATEWVERRTPRRAASALHGEGERDLIT